MIIDSKAPENFSDVELRCLATIYKAIKKQTGITGSIELHSIPGLTQLIWTSGNQYLNVTYSLQEKAEDPLWFDTIKVKKISPDEVASLDKPHNYNSISSTLESILAQEHLEKSR